jgi:hypothetical protein
MADCSVNAIERLDGAPAKEWEEGDSERLMLALGECEGDGVEGAAKGF